MKKIRILFGIMVLACMTACDNQQFTEMESGDYDMKYLSRLPGENENQLESFAVWAERDGEWQFENRKVVLTDNVWKAETTDLWQSGTYNFYAITGYKEEPITAEGVKGNFSINVGSNETDIDLMTAVTPNITYPAANGEPEPVPFHFYHEKAQVEIIVKAGTQLVDNAVINKIVLSGYYGGGAFTRTFQATERGFWDFTNVETTSWESLGFHQLEAGNSYTPLSNFMIPPQSLSTVTLTFEYSIGTYTNSREFVLGKTGSTSLQAGKIYKYQFTIQPNGIVFDGFTVPEWGETNTGGNINIGTTE